MFQSLRKKCPYSELFWSIFSRIRSRITPNMDTFHAVSLLEPGNLDVLICVFDYIYGLSFGILPLLWFCSLCEERFCITVDILLYCFTGLLSLLYWSNASSQAYTPLFSVSIFSVVLIFPVFLYQILQSIEKYLNKREHCL